MESLVDDDGRYEEIARAHGWVTIDEGGWDGSLICRRSHLETRDGPEFGSWFAACQCDGL